MEMKPWTGTLTAMLLVLASAMAFQARAQDTSCMNRLIPCLNYLNGTRDPPPSCCNPLKSVIDSNPDCLCALISRDGSDRAEQAGIDVSQAQLLPGRCGEHVNPLSCLAAANNARSLSISSALQLISLTSTASLLMSGVLHFYGFCIH
ncbi:lipid transfer-like protein VAS [Cucurbita maxima]|uniref:Lipid transfer-like protein VAS n=1 Tax=Cucurbita maxima TaxID=3661 RepID=A0A6J1J1M2_CUCMA|nr:lipid transfer-like protein VAS [Cucurbita maxima]